MKRVFWFGILISLLVLGCDTWWTAPEAQVTLITQGGAPPPIEYTIKSVGTRDIQSWYVSIYVDFVSGERNHYRDWGAEIPVGETLYRSIPAIQGDEGKVIESISVHEVRPYHL